MALPKTVRKKVQKDASRRPKAARVVILDSHPVVREGLAYVLRRETDLEVGGLAETHDQALELVASVRPQLIILGQLVKNASGLELVRHLHKRFPQVAILVVSLRDEKANAERAIQAGAAGYINAEEPTDKILEAIRQVLRGEIYLSQKLALQLVAELAGHPPRAAGSILDSLTDRELEILELIGDGLGRRQIADRLHLDVNTVETYRARLRAKLRLRDARDLLQYAIQLKHAKTPGKSAGHQMVPAYYPLPVFPENRFHAGRL